MQKSSSGQNEQNDRNGQRALRREASALGVDELTQGQQTARTALKTLLEHMLADARAWKEQGGLVADSRQSSRCTRSQHSLRDPFPLIDLDRTARVIFLDGTRGVGKSTLVVSMVHAWSRAAAAALCERPNRQPSKSDYEIPGLLPVNILDFRPFPEASSVGMRLLSAFSPLVRYFAKLNEKQDDCSTSSRLESRFDTLNRSMADWSKASRQPEDRYVAAEQIRQRNDSIEALYDDFRDFVDALSNEVNESLAPVWKTPLFLVVIDDADLVAHVSTKVLELLRRLYHPQVAWLFVGNEDVVRDSIRFELIKETRELVGDRHGEPASKDILSVAQQNLIPRLYEKLLPEEHHIELKGLSRELVLRRLAPDLHSMPVGAPRSDADDARLKQYCEADATSKDLVEEAQRRRELNRERQSAMRQELGLESGQRIATHDSQQDRSSPHKDRSLLDMMLAHRQTIDCLPSRYRQVEDLCAWISNQREQGNATAEQLLVKLWEGMDRYSYGGMTWDEEQSQGPHQTDWADSLELNCDRYTSVNAYQGARFLTDRSICLRRCRRFYMVEEPVKKERHIQPEKASLLILATDLINGGSHSNGASATKNLSPSGYSLHLVESSSRDHRLGWPCPDWDTFEQYHALSEAFWTCLKDAKLELLDPDQIARLYISVILHLFQGSPASIPRLENLPSWKELIHGPNMVGTSLAAVAGTRASNSATQDYVEWARRSVWLLAAPEYGLSNEIAKKMLDLREEKKGDFAADKEQETRRRQIHKLLAEPGERESRPDLLKPDIDHPWHKIWKSCGMPTPAEE